jgi:pantothenate kinase
VVLVEGNYVLLYDIQPWDRLRGVFEERWFISCDLGVARERVIKRHISTGETEEIATFRADNNDLLNGRLIDEVSRKFADRVVESLS